MIIQLKINRLILILLFCSLSHYANAQNNDYKFEKLTVRDGLAHNNVYAIFQDNTGYLWFGTQDGLNKYDGYSFKAYRHEANNPNSLATGNFGKIYQDSSGVFWFGTFGGGLDIYDPKTNKFTNYSHDPKNNKSLSSNQILFIFEDSKHNIWIGTANGGLNRFNKEEKNFTRYQPDENNPNSFSSERAKCMDEDPEGNLWFATRNGLNKYNPETDNFTIIEHDPENINSPGANDIQYIFIDETGEIWMACRDAGLSIYNQKTGKYKHYSHNPENPKSLSDNNTEFILKDSYGNFWIGTYLGGLNKFDPETEEFTCFKNDPKDQTTISHNEIEYILEDRSKNLWIATRGGGINKLDLKPKKFSNIIHNPNNRNSLPFPSVMAIVSDTCENIWIGTDGGGLTKYDKSENHFTHFKNNPSNQNSLSVNRIWSLHIDKQGIIWAGTYQGGLNRIEMKNGKYHFTRYLNDPNNDKSLANNQINSIAEDKDGTIWLATSDGLHKLVKEGNPEDYYFERYYLNAQYSNIYTDNYINKILIDSKNNFWVGSFSGGIFEFKPENGMFIRYSPIEFNNSEVKTDIRVISLFETRKNEILLGTESNGIIHFDYENKKFNYYIQNEALLDNMIVGMQDDDMGNLWISTSRGLIKYSPWSKIIEIYSHTDGLVSSGFNRNAIHTCKDDEMYFGSNGGLTHFYPLEVTNNPYPPNVGITDFKVLNKSIWKKYLLPFEKLVEEDNLIELTKKDYFFTIEFAALDYTAPNENQYKYILEDFNENWIHTTDRTATYTNLDPGTYTFKVKACNNDKVWNETPTEITIKVIPPFYKTKLFILIIIVLIALAIFGYIRFRTISLIRDKKNLEEKVKERTNEINLQKEELESQAENLEKINKELENQQNKLEKLVQERTKDLEIAKNKAEESDNLKSAFLANMSHEIRTPMNAIIGFSNLLNDRDIESGQKKELTSLIVKNSNSLLNLIDDIIDIAKIEAGQLKINLKECTVKALLNDLLLEFSEIANTNENLSIKIDTKPIDKDIKVLADPYRLEQIFKNLLSNAIKFTEKGAIEYGYNLSSDNSTVFFVKDSGIGLSPEQQKNIFSRFTKVENDRQKIYRGAGLGLTISKYLVEMMNGKLWVESELGKGSIFYFSLPMVDNIEENKTQAKQKNNSQNFSWNNKTILVAEDEESNYKFLEMIIKKTNAEILWAKNGVQAINICNGTYPIDLILMDIKMPEMSGLEAIKEIRKSKSDIPIIVQSAFAMPEDRDQSFNAGATDFISKPIGKEKLLKTINKYLTNI